MNLLTPEIQRAFLAHAQEVAPMEACGLVVVEQGAQVLRIAENVADDRLAGFRIAGAELARAEDQGLVAILHSHPDGPPTPSMGDRVGCEHTGHPWAILGLPSEDWAFLEPSGYRAPLIGRPYAFGLLDCWSLVRDHFVQELGIDLPDFERRDRFWERGENLFLDHALSAGFQPAPGELRPNDVLMMAIRSNLPNHCAVYLGDQTILHHRTGRLSGRELYGGFWPKATTHTFRHGSLV